MFSAIKWLFIALLLLSGFYLASFYMGLDRDAKNQIKKDAIEAIDAGDATVLTAPLSLKVKEDLSKKKASFFEIIRQKLRKTLEKDEPENPGE